MTTTSFRPTLPVLASAFASDSLKDDSIAERLERCDLALEVMIDDEVDRSVLGSRHSIYHSDLGRHSPWVF